MPVKRINLLNVPLDILDEEEIENTIMELLEKKGAKHIVFVTIWDLLKARKNGEFRNMITNADLCLPISKSLIRGASFLKKEIPNRREPFTIIIDFLNVIDSHYKSLYLFGGRQESLLIAEKNVKITFPGIRFVGRFSGYYNKQMEQHIIQAMTKAEPSLIIMSKGIPNGRKWIYRNKDKFNSSIFIYEENVIDIFSKFKRRPSQEVFNSGLDELIKFLKNPFRIFLLFSYSWYNILLVFYKLFRKDT